jgi:pantetheine-phosphate adenylyltransferase
MKNSIGLSLKAERERRKLTQIELANLTGIRQSHISCIENDKYVPSFSTIEKLSDALQIDPQVLRQGVNVSTIRAIYAGSFDPLTNGHLWVIRQAMQLFDELIVAIGENPAKKCTFSLDERLDMLRLSIPSGNVSFKHFTNRYLVDFAVEEKASFIVRGIRNSADFEYEKVIRHVNADIDPSVTTVFLIPPRELSEHSSSFVKALCGPENWQQLVGKMVPLPVFDKLIERQIQPR